MPQPAQGRPEPGTSYGHHLVDGEWVEITLDEHLRLVTPDGVEVDPDELTDFGRYEFTVIVDGEPVHAYSDTALSGESGRSSYRTDAGESVDDLGPGVEEVPDYAYSVITDDGTVEHRYGRGGHLTLDEDGNPVNATGGEDRYDIQFSTFAMYQGRRAVVGVDSDGEPVLLTPSGMPVPVEVDWSQVRRVDPGPLEGEPIAIGDYALDPGAGAVERVYLFPDGSQAVRNDDGTYERVIVPTEAEYPEGRPIFQGSFYAGAELGTAGETEYQYAEVFAFADGQTATYVDGELVLVDMAVEVHYPDGVPISCGPYPGGELFVFPDGTQVLRANDGTWGIGSLPDIPPYEELVERYGEVEVDDPITDTDLEGDPDRPLDVGAIAGPGLGDPAFGGLLDDDITVVTRPRELVRERDAATSDETEGESHEIADDVDPTTQTTPTTPTPPPVTDPFGDPVPAESFVEEPMVQEQPVDVLEEPSVEEPSVDVVEEPMVEEQAVDVVEEPMPEPVEPVEPIAEPVTEVYEDAVPEPEVDAYEAPIETPIDNSAVGAGSFDDPLLADG